MAKNVYMPIYDDVADSESSPSPVSTILTDPCASSPTSSVATQCPVYENVEEFSSLCALTPPSSARSAVSMDFLRHIPPPPIGIEGEKSGHSTMHYNTEGRSKKALDMRPLSLPAHQIKRMERRNNHRGLFICLGVSTIFVFSLAFAIWYFFSDLEKHYVNLTKRSK